MDIFDLIANNVIITKDEYVEYRNFKDAVTREQEKLRNIQECTKSIVNEDPESLLKLLFKRSRMGCDSRAEQVDLDGYYSGFDIDAVTFLRNIGYTDEMLIDYINKQWDLKGDE